MSHEPAFARRFARVAAIAALGTATVAGVATPADAQFMSPSGPRWTPESRPVLSYGPQADIEYFGEFGWDAENQEPFAEALPHDRSKDVHSISSCVTPGAGLAPWTAQVTTAWAESVVWTVDGDVVRVDYAPEASDEAQPASTLAGLDADAGPDEFAFEVPDLPAGVYEVEARAFSRDHGQGSLGDMARFEVTIGGFCEGTIDVDLDAGVDIEPSYGFAPFRLGR